MRIPALVLALLALLAATLLSAAPGLALDSAAPGNSTAPTGREMGFSASPSADVERRFLRLSGYFDWLQASGVRVGSLSPASVSDDGKDARSFFGPDVSLHVHGPGGIGGISLASRRDIPADALLLRVPADALLIFEPSLVAGIKLTPEHRLTLTDQVAIFLIQQRSDPSSKWYHFLHSLPEIFRTPIYFEAEEAADLTGTDAWYYFFSREKHISENFAEIRQALETRKASGRPVVIEPELFTRDAFRWALSVQWNYLFEFDLSRSPLEDAQLLKFMAPLAELFQPSNPFAGAELPASGEALADPDHQPEDGLEEAVENVACTLTLATDASRDPDSYSRLADVLAAVASLECRALRDIPAGSMLFRNYGKPNSNAVLMSEIGTAFSDNHADTVVVPMPKMSVSDIARTHPVFNFFPDNFLESMSSTTNEYSEFTVDWTGMPTEDPALMAYFRLWEMTPDERDRTLTDTEYAHAVTLRLLDGRPLSVENEIAVVKRLISYIGARQARYRADLDDEYASLDRIETDLAEAAVGDDLNLYHALMVKHSIFTLRSAEQLLLRVNSELLRQRLEQLQADPDNLEAPQPGLPKAPEAPPRTFSLRDDL
ncbi:hypothetical protein H696_05903 [Fonticula alba]|uniref:Rubisco LSMT substrate-binding domain-containing protein n=1 Tax=Fonticula alba TaxID=691883 RepID=A0A058Z0G2_FONAL|nr:hypothetical protein H696_05903 [Fonticula alba]KCV67616.1 hypothetical protein H696_05903 [Fonticula alba]|eukprot:XP_009497954.1 hypothetical protein H696_05903 [Fonticula alba]